MDGDHGWMGECAFESGCLNASLSSMKKEAKSPSKNDENGEGFLKVLKKEKLGNNCLCFRYSKRGHGTSKAGITWEVVRNVESWGCHCWFSV